MKIVTMIATNIVRLLEFLLVARAILSWFPQLRGSKLSDFLYQVTEPLIMPFRSLLERIQFFRTFPLDISFLLAFLTLEIILSLLYQL